MNEVFIRGFDEIRPPPHNLNFTQKSNSNLKICWQTRHNMKKEEAISLTLQGKKSNFEKSLRYVYSEIKKSALNGFFYVDLYSTTTFGDCGFTDAEKDEFINLLTIDGFYIAIDSNKINISWDR